MGKEDEDGHDGKEGGVQTSQEVGTSKTKTAGTSMPRRTSRIVESISWLSAEPATVPGLWVRSLLDAYEGLLGCLSGASWGAPWGLWEAFWGHLGGLLGVSWELLGSVSWDLLEALF